jgi:hypothetical protein
MSIVISSMLHIGWCHSTMPDRTLAQAEQAMHLFRTGQESREHDAMSHIFHSATIGKHALILDEALDMYVAERFARARADNSFLGTLWGAIPAYARRTHCESVPPSHPATDQTTTTIITTTAASQHHHHHHQTNPPPPPPQPPHDIPRAHRPIATHMSPIPLQAQLFSRPLALHSRPAQPRHTRVLVVQLVGRTLTSRIRFRI